METHQLNTKQQGSIGVTAAVLYYTKQGFTVCLPVSDAQRYDLVVDKNGVMYRVEVKTSSYKAPSGNYAFQLATSGGNRSWKGIQKPLSKEDCDLVFLYAMDGSAWEFPISALDGKTSKIPDPSHKFFP